MQGSANPVPCAMQRPGSAGPAEKAIVYTHIHLHRLLIKEALDSKGVRLALLCGGMDRREQQQAVDVFQARQKSFQTEHFTKG